MMAEKNDKLRILRSDLSDCFNPKIVARYPHLGTASMIRDLRARIAEEEEARQKDD